MAKTKALISFAVTAKLICVFVFAYAKNQLSQNEAHLKMGEMTPFIINMDSINRTRTADVKILIIFRQCRKS